MVDKSVDISAASNIDPSKSVTGAGEQIQKKPGDFGKFMEGNTTEGTSKNQNISPLNLEQSQITPGKATHESIISQMNSTSSVLGDIQEQIKNQKQSSTNLSQVKKDLLRSKLKNANTLIREASKKAGVETGPPLEETSRQSPLSKFLNILTDGQNQLEQAKNHISTLNSQGGQLNPGDMLLMQVKLAHAQQEIEYSSVLLSTAVSDIKTMMNIQL